MWFSDSETVRDIVYDATGYDIDVVTKEDLHKEMREQCLSAISFTSESKEEPTEEVKYLAANVHSTHFLKLHFFLWWLIWAFTPQPLRAVGVLFSPMVSRWAGGRR